MLKFSDAFGVCDGATQRWEEEANGCDKEKGESELIQFWEFVTVYFSRWLARTKWWFC